MQVTGGLGGGAPPRAEAILEWLQKEMACPVQLPTAEQLRKVCRGNMAPVWSFLLRRVRSDSTVDTARRNMMVHGVGAKWKDGSEVVAVVAERKERNLAEKEVEALRAEVRRRRNELKAKMVELAREETERKRMLDERANARHKQVMLEAYDQQCDEAIKIFAEYQRRLYQHVTQARNILKSSSGSPSELAEDLQSLSEKEAVYSTVKGSKTSDDFILIETPQERNIRRACETLATYMVEKIRSASPAYDGSGVNLNCQLDVDKIVADVDDNVPEEVKAVVADALKNPALLLNSIIAYTSRVNALVRREIEKIDIRADAELLGYKYENDEVKVAASSDASSPLPYQANSNGKNGADLLRRGTYNQLLERQKAHVQQFVATEDALNKAAEAKSLSQKLIKRLQGTTDVVTSQSLAAGGASQHLGNARHFELDVWEKEREVAGVRASLNTLTSEVNRLNQLCIEWKEAEESLRKKWKKIEEFDGRRSELESIHNVLLKANMDASVFWDQQPAAARGYAAKTVIPACNSVAKVATGSLDLIEKEASAFHQSLNNRLYMLPSTPQALVESMGVNGTGPETVMNAERSASLLTARAGAGDPSAIPSICRISAALQYPTSVGGSDAGLASVLGSLEFCLKLRGSEASILEDLSRTIDLVRVQRDLVENDRVLLKHARRVQKEYSRVANNCLDEAAKQEKDVMEKWLPELRNAAVDAQKCSEDCQRVKSLVDEWWEQPAGTAVDWVTVDGQNVCAWINIVKQLQMAVYDQNLL